MGQGLAGSCLAFALLQQNQQVTVIDRGHKTASTSVAAGVFHPIQFRKLSKSWNADVMIPAVHRFFTEMETWIGESVLESREVLRLFASTEEFNNWYARSQEPEFEGFLSRDTVSSEDQPGLEIPHFGGLVLGGGWVNLPLWLAAVRKRLLAAGALKEQTWDWEQLKLTEQGLVHPGIDFPENAKGVIFCEGWQLPHNPFFNWLPFQGVKGEVLTIHCPGLQLNRIANRKLIVIPLGEDRYRIGSTNNWADIDLEISQTAREELLERLSEILKLPFEVLDQHAGIRPTVPDRRPLLGRHPHSPHLALFNGLGSRGVMYAPHYAEQMAAHLISGAALDPEVDLIRFRKRLPALTLQDAR